MFKLYLQSIKTLSKYKQKAKKLSISQKEFLLNTSIGLAEPKLLRSATVVLNHTTPPISCSPNSYTLTIPPWGVARLLGLGRIDTCPYL